MKGCGDFESPLWSVGHRGAADTGPAGGVWGYAGRNIHFGIREHAMTAVMTGMALHGGVVPFGATFLSFSDYMRPSIRLAALSKAHVIYIWTHDSIALGEDGPTHQPVEQLAGLRAHAEHDGCCGRATRPKRWRRGASRCSTRTARWASCSPGRSCQCWIARCWRPHRVSRKGRLHPCGSGWTPAGRHSDRHRDRRSRWRWRRTRGSPAKGFGSRVVSMPCWELFERQPQTYRDSVLPPGVRARVSIEAASPFGWERYVGLDGAIIGVADFGASAPGPVVMREFGFTPAHVVETARRLLKK